MPSFKTIEVKLATESRLQPETNLKNSRAVAILNLVSAIFERVRAILNGRQAAILKSGQRHFRTCPSGRLGLKKLRAKKALLSLPTPSQE